MEKLTMDTDKLKVSADDLKEIANNYKEVIEEVYFHLNEIQTNEIIVSDNANSSINKLNESFNNDKDQFLKVVTCLNELGNKIGDYANSIKNCSDNII